MPSKVEKINDPEISVVTLKNASGMSVEVTNFGATIKAIHALNRQKTTDNVVLGFRNAADYKAKAHPRFGGTMGRCTGRSYGDLHFNDDGGQLVLNRPVENPQFHMHGGNNGFDKVHWNIEHHIATAREDSVTLGYYSQDGEEGYPGGLHVQVIYTLTEDNELKIKYWARLDDESVAADISTLVNMTNHFYLNLAGEGRGDVLSHIVQVKAAEITDADELQVFNGKTISLDDNPLDFREPANLGERVQATGGIDHNYILERGNSLPHELVEVANIFEPDSQREVVISTTQPAAQVYGGHKMPENIKGYSGKIYPKHAGLCFEAQKTPGSENYPDFPSMVLKPGEEYHEETVLRFSFNRGRSR